MISNKFRFYIKIKNIHLKNTLPISTYTSKLYAENLKICIYTQNTISRLHFKSCHLEPNSLVLLTI